MNREAKQVIVMRKDLNMRKGKMVAQGAHASLGAVLLLQEDDQTGALGYGDSIHVAFLSWISGTFTKVCVSVDSEQALMDVCDAAEFAGLPVKLITDNGLTEFHGVPTKTCLAIGPAWSDEIDKVTGHLRLL